MLASPNVFLRPKLLLISSSFPFLSQCDFFLYYSISEFTLFNINLTLFVSITGLCVRRTSPIYNIKYGLSSKCYEGNISTPCKRGSKLCASLNSNASFVYQVKLGKQWTMRIHRNKLLRVYTNDTSKHLGRSYQWHVTRSVAISCPQWKAYDAWLIPNIIISRFSFQVNMLDTS